MKVEFYGIQELSNDKVGFYTVLLGDNENRPTEFAEFSRRMKIKSANSADYDELIQFINNTIGQNGALDQYFKKEDCAERIKQPTPDEFDKDLPDPKDYGLRLYCLRLSEEVVILFNGDRKTYGKAQKCPNCADYFNMANKISKAIIDAIYGGIIQLDGLDIVYMDETSIIEI